MVASRVSRRKMYWRGLAPETHPPRAHLSGRSPKGVYARRSEMISRLGREKNRQEGRGGRIRGGGEEDGGGGAHGIFLQDAPSRAPEREKLRKDRWTREAMQAGSATALWGGSKGR